MTMGWVRASDAALVRHFRDLPTPDWASPFSPFFILLHLGDARLAPTLAVAFGGARFASANMVHQTHNDIRESLVNGSHPSYTHSHVTPVHRAQMLESARRLATENARLASSSVPLSSNYFQDPVYSSNIIRNHEPRSSL